MLLEAVAIAAHQPVFIDDQDKGHKHFWRVVLELRQGRLSTQELPTCRSFWASHVCVFAIHTYMRSCSFTCIHLVHIQEEI
jgi:hypothetical protein